MSQINFTERKKPIEWVLEGAAIPLGPGPRIQRIYEGRLSILLQWQNHYFGAVHRDVHHKASMSAVGRVHTEDFILLFCSSPGCENLCETEEPVHPAAAFTCRACNPVGTGLHFQYYQFDMRLRGGAPEGTQHIRNQGSNSHTAKKILREFFDKTDTMITGGQILKSRRVERLCPDWMLDDNEVRGFLLARFPAMLATRCERPRWLSCEHPGCQLGRKQREAAALWAGVIYLYHRIGLPASEVAAELILGTPISATSEELKPSEAVIERIVLTINRRRVGLQVNGKPLSNGRRGRKKKTACSAGID